jgi:hypothetical protein
MLELLTLKNVIAVLSGATTLFLSVKRYRNSFKKERKEIYKIPMLKQRINYLLKSLEDSVVSRKIICATAEVTNGGGIPRIDKPIYIKALNANHGEVLRLWGKDKTKCSPNMENAISNMLKDGVSGLDISEFQMKMVATWGNTREIAHVFYFLIGIDGNKRALILSVNSDSSKPLTPAEELIFFNAAKELKSIINETRPYYWQQKIL